MHQHHHWVQQVPGSRLAAAHQVKVLLHKQCVALMQHLLLCCGCGYPPPLLPTCRAALLCVQLVPQG